MFNQILVIIRTISDYICQACSYTGDPVNDQARNCIHCGIDITETPANYTRCRACHDSAIIIRKCRACNTNFYITLGLNKYYCARTDCIGLKSMTKEQRNASRKTLSKKGYSDKAIVWLSRRAKLDATLIKHALDGGEHTIKIGAKTYHTDGYAPATNTVYEFYGDFYHGNINLYPRDKQSPLGKTYGELYNATIERENDIKRAGYNVVSIWEHDYDNGAI